MRNRLYDPWSGRFTEFYVNTGRQEVWGLSAASVWSRAALTAGVSIVVMVLGSPLSAQAAGRCRHPARSTSDIEACAALRLERAESTLKRAEVAARQVAGKEALATFDAAARAWRTYRDAECHTIYVSYTGGSGAAAAMLNCKATLTDERIRTLRLVYSPEG
jgi:uncharacterized protein YecT (DUF1311 family)